MLTSHERGFLLMPCNQPNAKYSEGKATRLQIDARMSKISEMVARNGQLLREMQGHG